MDTTFREKTYGVSFANGEKLSIISQLDSIGVSFVELCEQDQKIANSFKWQRSKPVLFLSGKHEDVPQRAENVTVRMNFLPPGCETAHSSHLSPTVEENIANVKRTVAALKKKGKNVFLDAQHYFDGFYQNSDYVLTLLETASKAGASRLVLCDSRGASLPEQVKIATKFAARYLANQEILLGVHAHNDCGLAVSNTLSAISVGARHVQATINGIGERSGNADLCQLLPLLILKLGYNILNSPKPKEKQLEQLKILSESTSKACGFSIPNQPFVGPSAFSHSDPRHIEAISKNPSLFEPIEPSWVGNSRYAGTYDLSTIQKEISKLGLYAKDLSFVAKRVLERMRELEAIGYKFGNALASVHLLILETMGSDIVPFSITGWETSTVTDLGRTRSVRATIRAKVGQGSNIHDLSASSEGVGPIHAIDLALKKALSDEFPELQNVKLTSYSLDIVDALTGSAASARARTGFFDPYPPAGSTPSVWATVSVSDDVIDSSIRALVEGYRYKLIFLNRRERFSLPDWRAAIA